MDNKVFVYGSLQKGMGNHRIVQRYVRSVQNASMRGWMFNLGCYPGVVVGSGVVHGQLLELSQPERALSAMDILEGFQEPEHPRNLFERVKTIVSLDHGQTAECFAYILHDRNKAEICESAAFLPSGKWGCERELRLYIAYGSCMSEASFSETVANYTRLGRAELEGYRVGFTKYSAKWGGGVADLLPAPGETMEGVLYLLPADEIEPLDEREGANLVPPAYRRTNISVSVDGMRLPAFSYEVADKSKREIAPSDAYMCTILDGTNVLSGAYAVRLREAMNRLRDVQ
ncbi:gamma-glutamylcyclotransferase [Paenibacillus thermotolerans]|uniref:gamma-glutamylcyclotransferase n=1 Tax=Paenibacillus thermotolerans TaxID=3027807 RepID=UPI002368A246|nr:MULTISPECIES: gamma-glutamylcyclotransferase [unclassified Paenibacillus]